MFGFHINKINVTFATYLKILAVYILNFAIGFTNMYINTYILEINSYGHI